MPRISGQKMVELIRKGGHKALREHLQATVGTESKPKSAAKSKRKPATRKPATRKPAAQGAPVKNAPDSRLAPKAQPSPTEGE